MGQTLSTHLSTEILAALPQTQCTRCCYPDCAAYAHAIAHDAIPINQCPPGGDEGILRLAAITGQTAVPLNPANGVEGARGVAVIDENWCIGCTLCIDVCPADAILGSNKLMHTVIEAHCTGCELCIPVCPVDCIVMENVTGDATGWAAWSEAQADEARTRYGFRGQRLKSSGLKVLEGQISTLANTLEDLPARSSTADPVALEQKRTVVSAALARARERADEQKSKG